MIDKAGRASEDQLDERWESITPFDAAAYVYELTGELARLSRGAAFSELARLLEEAREHAAQEMIKAGRAAHAQRGNSASGEMA